MLAKQIIYLSKYLHCKTDDGYHSNLWRHDCIPNVYVAWLFTFWIADITQYLIWLNSLEYFKVSG